MLWPTVKTLSAALKTPSILMASAVELLKLHVAHRAALADGEEAIARSIEDSFHDELHKFRPMCNLADAAKVPRPFSHKLHAALVHFGLSDDPLTKQLEALLGRAERRKKRPLAAYRVADVDPEAVTNYTNLRDSLMAGPLREAAVEPRPNERPFPLHADRDYSAANLSPHKRRYSDRERGHWVLNDPEIALDRREGKDEPW